LMSENKAFLVAILPTRSFLKPFMSVLFYVLPSSMPSSIFSSVELLYVHAMCSISTNRHFFFHLPSSYSSFFLSFLFYFFLNSAELHLFRHISEFHSFAHFKAIVQNVFTIRQSLVSESFSCLGKILSARRKFKYSSAV
jgi:hypothetical protein